jgi:uncharacterized protein (DUF983 family)
MSSRTRTSLFYRVCPFCGYIELYEVWPSVMAFCACCRMEHPHKITRDSNYALAMSRHVKEWGYL